MNRSGDTSYPARSFKLLLTSINIIIFIFIFRIFYYPYRTGGDESVVAPDIQTLLESGHIFDPVYHAGIGFQLQFSIILRILGISYSNASQWVSPSIGAIFYSIFLLVIYSLWKRSTDNPIWWSFILGFQPLFIFASLFNRIVLTTHKQLTIALFVLTVFIVHTIINDHRSSRRHFIILLIFLSIISIMNNIWGLIYGIIVGLPLLLQYISKMMISAQQRHSMVRKAIVVFGFAVIINWQLQYSDSFSNFKSFLLSAFGFIRRTTGSNTVYSASTTWPALHLYGYEVSLLYIWISGIIFIAFLSTISTLYIIHKYISRSHIYSIDNFALGLNIGFSVFVIAALSSGDIDTVRRLIPVPGVFSVMYVSIILSDKTVIDYPSRSTLLKCLFVMLIISSILAVPRMAPSGGINPHDVYIAEAEESSLSFIANYGKQNCYYLPNSETKSAAIKKGIYLGNQFHIYNPVIKDNELSKIHSSDKVKNYAIRTPTGNKCFIV